MVALPTVSAATKWYDPFCEEERGRRCEVGRVVSITTFWMSVRDQRHSGEVKKRCTCNNMYILRMYVCNMWVYSRCMSLSVCITMCVSTCALHSESQLLYKICMYVCTEHRYIQYVCTIYTALYSTSVTSMG